MIKYKDILLTEEEAKKKLACETFSVRLYDNFDMYWIDIKLNTSWEEAIKTMKECTKNGAIYTKYTDGAYYAIFPSNSKMLFDGKDLI